MIDEEEKVSFNNQVDAFIKEIQEVFSSKLRTGNLDDT